MVARTLLGRQRIDRFGLGIYRFVGIFCFFDHERVGSH